jgi:hypothetical protein
LLVTELGLASLVTELGLALMVFLGLGLVIFYKLIFSF